MIGLSTMQRYFRFYPLSILVIAVVTTLCLMPIEEPPLQDVAFIDKWAHIVLFGGICSVIVFEMAINHHFRYKWIAPCFAALYGGAVELMQAYFTTCRSGDWLDFYADAVGAFVLFPVAYFVCKRLPL